MQHKQFGGVTTYPRHLSGEDFSDWRELVGRDPNWTAYHIARLERSARDLGERNTPKWRARGEPLSLNRASMRSHVPLKAH
jgi:hypothetical protein